MSTTVASYARHLLVFDEDVLRLRVRVDSRRGVTLIEDNLERRVRGREGEADVQPTVQGHSGREVADGTRETAVSVQTHRHVKVSLTVLWWHRAGDGNNTDGASDISVSTDDFVIIRHRHPYHYSACYIENNYAVYPCE